MLAKLEDGYHIISGSVNSPCAWDGRLLDEPKTMCAPGNCCMRVIGTSHMCVPKDLKRPNYLETLGTVKSTDGYLEVTAPYYQTSSTSKCVNLETQFTASASANLNKIP